jgi:CheY-like chemotaxis protein
MAPDTTPHVLLVDDDLRLRGLLETFLRREGFKVAVAGNGQQMDKCYVGLYLRRNEPSCPAFRRGIS